MLSVSSATFVPAAVAKLFVYDPSLGPTEVWLHQLHHSMTTMET
jgi:hypothetical protein